MEIKDSLIKSLRKVLALAKDYIGKGGERGGEYTFRAALFHCSFLCFLILVIISIISLLFLGLCTYMGFG